MCVRVCASVLSASRDGVDRRCQKIQEAQLQAQESREI